MAMRRLRPTGMSYAAYKEQRDNLILVAWKQGQPVKGIARELGVSPHTVRNTLRRHDVYQTSQDRFPAELEKARDAYHDGMSYAAAAEHLGVSEHRIHYLYKLIRRQDGERQAHVERRRRASQMLRDGHTLDAIADELGTSSTSAARWALNKHGARVDTLATGNAKKRAKRRRAEMRQLMVAEPAISWAELGRRLNLTEHAVKKYAELHRDDPECAEFWRRRRTSGLAAHRPDASMPLAVRRRNALRRLAAVREGRRRGMSAREIADALGRRYDTISRDVRLLKKVGQL